MILHYMKCYIRCIITNTTRCVRFDTQKCGTTLSAEFSNLKNFAGEQKGWVEGAKYKVIHWVLSFIHEMKFLNFTIFLEIVKI